MRWVRRGLSGLHEVTYIGRKPPAAWKEGTDAENRLDLESLTEEAVFFEEHCARSRVDLPKERQCRRDRRACWCRDWTRPVCG